VFALLASPSHAIYCILPPPSCIAPWHLLPHLPIFVSLLCPDPGKERGNEFSYYYQKGNRAKMNSVSLSYYYLPLERNEGINGCVVDAWPFLH